MVIGFDGVLEAHDELQLLCLPIQQARQWISRHPNFNRAFLTYLGRQMHNWRKKGIISLDHGHVQIEKLEALLRRTNLHLPPSETGSAEHTQ